jgi:hypothetical protein
MAPALRFADLTVAVRPAFALSPLRVGRYFAAESEGWDRWLAQIIIRMPTLRPASRREFLHRLTNR